MKRHARRVLPVVLALSFLAWVLFIVILIATGPAQPPGQPTRRRLNRRGAYRT